jgi:hypothetical protein
MGIPSPSDQDGKIPMVWLGESEVDCSRLPPEPLAGVPVGGFETEMTWLGMTEVDCSPAAQNPTDGQPLPTPTVNGNVSGAHDAGHDLGSPASDERRASP